MPDPCVQIQNKMSRYASHCKGEDTDPLSIDTTAELDLVLKKFQSLRLKMMARQSLIQDAMDGKTIYVDGIHDEESDEELLPKIESFTEAQKQCEVLERVIKHLEYYIDELKCAKEYINNVTAINATRSKITQDSLECLQSQTAHTYTLNGTIYPNDLDKYSPSSADRIEEVYAIPKGHQVEVLTVDQVDKRLAQPRQLNGDQQRRLNVSPSNKPRIY